MKPFITPPTRDQKLPSSPEMEQSVAAVEKIVRYEFTDKKLLEEALTHSSINYIASYHRLAFLGDSILGAAITTDLYRTYRKTKMDQGHLSLLRSANVDNASLARVAVNHGLYPHLHHGLSSQESQHLDDQVREFMQAGESESVKPPKVLADIVESVAAAIYVDLGYDLNKLWRTFKHLLESVAPQDLPGHPVTMLYNLCQKHHKHVEIKQWRDHTKNLSIASVHVDDKEVASNSAKNMKCARLNAANQALSELSKSLGENDRSPDDDGPIRAMQKLNELCAKKRLPKPVYNIEEELGPPHKKKFVCSVTIETLCTTGDEKPRKKEAENSAAWLMICCLEDVSEDDFMINNYESDYDFMINNNNPLPSVYGVWRIISRGVMRLFVFFLKGVSLLIILSIVAKLLME